MCQQYREQGAWSWRKRTDEANISTKAGSGAIAIARPRNRDTMVVGGRRGGGGGRGVS